MMKRCSLVLAAILGLGLAGAAHAADGYGRRGVFLGPTYSHHGETYLLLRGGVFEPNDDREGLRGYDSGWSFSAGIGSRLSPFFAVEAMAGAYGAEDGPDRIRVVPITVGGRFIVPNPFLEPYLGGGVGIYFADLREVAVAPDFSGIDDSSTALGGYLSMGVDAWLSPHTALNFEGAYHVADPSFESKAGNSFDVQVGGWRVNVGLRLEFY